MTTISPAQETVLSILRKPRTSDAGYRLLKYCVHSPVEEGILLYNCLTCELLLLSEEEFANRLDSDYLRANWFVVPETLNDKEFAELVRWVMTNRQKKAKNITSYTILSTTDCNARCFYCFELGRSRIPMSEETAHKTAQYITEHCGGEKVGITWFGGEPLFNLPVIDAICQDLKENGVTFRSSVVSNGYLFTPDIIEKAKKHWNTFRVQITLDGTEAVYNRSKAYIYRGESPYQVVIRNIGHLLDAQIAVNIRLNMDLYNAEDLVTLVDELGSRFAGRKGLSVYANHIFDWSRPLKDIHSEEEWDRRYAAMDRLNSRIAHHGFGYKKRIPKKLRLNHCMADSGRSVLIAPTGDIGLCEHHTENEFIGHIDRENFDTSVVRSWKALAAEIPECSDCFFYPNCVRLKKCTSGSSCFRHVQETKRKELLQGMHNEYQLWKSQSHDEEAEDISFC
jgi:radical SAM protein with 4Fe4S-binding SPASM domain